LSWQAPKSRLPLGIGIGLQVARIAGPRCPAIGDARSEDTLKERLLPSWMVPVGGVMPFDAARPCVTELLL